MFGRRFATIRKQLAVAKAWRQVAAAKKIREQRIQAKNKAIEEGRD